MIFGRATSLQTDPGTFWDFESVSYSDADQGIRANLSTSFNGTLGLNGNEVDDGIFVTGTSSTSIDDVFGVHVLRDSPFSDQIVVDGTFLNSRGNFIEVRLSEGDDTVDFTGMSGTARASWRNATDGVQVNLAVGVAGATYVATAIDNNLGDGDQIGTDTITFDDTTAKNVVRGTPFDDLFNGNNLDNIFRGSGGDDTINGGAGTDTATFTDAQGSVEVDLNLTGAGQKEVISDGRFGSDDLDSIENIRGGFFDDTITGNNLDNRLEGRSGNDQLIGGQGNDTLIGDDGDVPGLLGGNDILDGGEGNDDLFGGDGNDILRAGTGADQLFGEDGDDRLEIVNDQFVDLDGGDGQDTLFLDNGLDLDFSAGAINNLRYGNIEAIDLADGGLANILTLDLQSVLDFSNIANEDLDQVLPFVTPGAVAPTSSLVIDGESADAVNLANGGNGQWQQLADAPSFDNHDIYAYIDGATVLAAVAIDDDVTVNVVP